MEDFVLTRQRMKDWGLNKRPDVDVLVFSMGCIDEAHGPALQRDNDDVVARRTAVLACEKLGIQYAGHLPFVSDRVGEIARDWCPAWMPIEETRKGVADYIRHYIEIWPNRVSRAVIISGHGGNNFLKEDEERLSRETGVPVLYVSPFEGCKVTHPEHGKIEMEHASSGEHSVAAFMGVLDENQLSRINKLASEDPEGALRKWPPIAGLGGYVLFGGPKYEALRTPEWGMVEHAKMFLQEKRIIADFGAGKELFSRNLENTVNQIRKFSGQ